jgi:hypothetical protein
LTETESTAWDKLQTFRSKVERSHTCAYWLEADDLKTKVVVGLTTAMSRQPAIGWIRSDALPTTTTPGLLRIADKYDFNPAFWNGMMTQSVTRLDMAGHALSKWVEEPYRDTFLARLAETATLGGSVRILLLNPNGPAHAQRASSAGLVYRNRIYATLTALSSVIAALPEGRRDNVAVRWTADALRYMFIRSDTITVVSPYLSATDSKDALVFVFEPHSRHALTYAADFDKLFTAAEPVVWPIQLT